MSDDRRERILVRVEAILTELATNDGTGIHVYRNRAEFETYELPAYVLLDGVENNEVASSDKRGPQIMSLQPQIFYVPVPTENPMNDGMGPRLSAMRSAMVKALLLDEQLSELLGSNGYASYRGIETDMQTGAEVKGQFRMDFAFGYVFNVNKL